jgi:hypothetical protein
LGFHGHQPKAFTDRWHHDHAGRAIETGKRRLWLCTVPRDALGHAERSRALLQRGAIRPVSDDVQVGLSGHHAEGLDEVTDPLLRGEATNKEHAIGVSRSIRREQLRGHGHRRHDRRDAWYHRRNLGCEPVRHRRYGARVLEHVPQQRLGERLGAREAHVAPVHGRHQREIGESGGPCADQTSREPPVRVDDVRRELAPGACGRRELRAEKADEGQLRAP